MITLYTTLYATQQSAVEKNYCHCSHTHTHIIYQHTLTAGIHLSIRVPKLLGIVQLEVARCHWTQEGKHDPQHHSCNEEEKSKHQDHQS